MTAELSGSAKSNENIWMTFKTRIPNCEGYYCSKSFSENVVIILQFESEENFAGQDVQEHTLGNNCKLPRRGGRMTSLFPSSFSIKAPCGGSMPRVVKL